MRIVVGIATAGRPELLRVVIGRLQGQSRPPDAVILCAPTGDDIGELCETGLHLEVVVGPRGLTCQRNAILDRAGAFDGVVFFDDDFVPAADYLSIIEQIFVRHPDVAMITGTVLADGITGPGLRVEDAERLLQNWRDEPTERDFHDVTNGYGCNMALRIAAATAAGCRFDDRLPLYGWLEDVDFSAQLAACGRIVKASAARGVHLGIKRGRQSGVRLGYSQIANPIYLSLKGTVPWRRAMRQMSRNMAANLLRALKPEPYIDRIGRAAGNLKALRDLLIGRLAPERILEL